LQRYQLTCHRSELEPKQKKDYEPAVTDDEMDRAALPAPVVDDEAAPVGQQIITIIMNLHQPMTMKGRIMKMLCLVMKKMWLIYY
jgi:hypothetical protein